MNRRTWLAWASRDTDCLWCGASGWSVRRRVNGSDASPLGPNKLCCTGTSCVRTDWNLADFLRSGACPWSTRFCRKSTHLGPRPCHRRETRLQPIPWVSTPCWLVFRRIQKKWGRRRGLQPFRFHWSGTRRQKVSKRVPSRRESSMHCIVGQEGSSRIMLQQDMSQT